MIISVASGKGGTGKTTVAVNLAASLDNVQLLDCDVEEPNAHLFLKPRLLDSGRAAVLVPKIDESKCNYCGKCRQVCAYHAIAVLPKGEGRRGSVLVFPQLCHSCGGCSLLCPEKAITEVERGIGVIESGERAGAMRFVHGRLDIGEAMSPPLIRQVKARTDLARTVIADCPPGTSCPVIAAVRGSDVCILVTEPTPFGFHDLTLTVEVLKALRIPFGVVINRSDLGDERTENYCTEENIPVLMRIPFDLRIARACSKGAVLVEEMPEYAEKFRDLFEKAVRLVKGRS